MAINKVIYGNTTLIDLTSDTVEAKYVINNKIAHGANGEVFTGTIPWRMVIQETLLFFDNEEVNGQTVISDAGSVTGTTLVI